MILRALAGNLLRKPAPPLTPDPAAVAALRARLAEAEARTLGRGLAIRHVGAGGCNGCALELRATQNLIYDLARYGLTFTDSPRHADVLLITGAANRNMLEAIRETRAAMGAPVLIVAVGDCASDGGVFKGSPEIAGGAGAVVPVDLHIPGCPPAPAQIIEGLLALLEASRHDVKINWNFR